MKIILVVLFVLFFHSATQGAHRSLVLYQTWRDAKVAFVTRFPHTAPLLDEVSRPKVKFKKVPCWFDEEYQYYVVGIHQPGEETPIVVALHQTHKQLKLTLVHEFLHYLSYRFLSGEQYTEASKWIEENY